MQNLLPIGEYDYDSDEKSFDEAWSCLKECYEKKESIICFVVKCSEDNKSIELDYYGVKGTIKGGYITQNRLLHNEDLVGKTTCVYIYNLDERKKTFVGMRLRVEREAKEQLSSLKYGDMVEGVLKSFGNEESFAFVDIKEGIQAFLSIKKVTRMPSTCCNMSDYLQIGERIKGRVVYLEPKKAPRHETYCVISLLDLETNWADEIAHLKIGHIVSGYPWHDTFYDPKYYIEYSRNVCIEMESKMKLDKAQLVSAKITDIDYDNYKIYAEIEVEGNQNQEVMAQDQEDTLEEKETELKIVPKEEVSADNWHQLSMFRMQIKTEISPFCMHINETKDFDSTPNQYVSMRYIRQRIAQGILKKEHFSILEAVERLVYCTSKQIMSYLYCEKKDSDIPNQNKLNAKLDSMTKLALVDRFKFESESGKESYRVYFLNKNGHLVLLSYLHRKQTSYEPGLIAKMPEEIKRRLAANQVILAYKETFDFMQNFQNYRTIMADLDIPIRPSAIIQFINSTLLIEVKRRNEGWQEDLHEKMDRYQILFRNHDTQKLPYNTFGFLKMPLYLLVVCEDLEHAREVKNTLFGHEMYARIFFTYDLLIFQREVNSSIFRFKGQEQEIVYYNLTELFHYNLENPDERKREEESSGDVVDKFYVIMQKSYTAGLAYLQTHDCKELQEFVQSKLYDLYRIEEAEGYQMVYPEDKQYFIYLLYLINQDLIRNPTASFHEGAHEQKEDLGKVDGILDDDMLSVSEENTLPAELEKAVYLVLSELEKWMQDFDWERLGMCAPLKVTKHAIQQTNGVQYGYDVGMNFRYNSEEYRLGFECKSHQGEDHGLEKEKKTRLSISSYAYNLLEYFMYCQRAENIHNYWILICPFRDLQNNFYENLFQKWNQDIPFMQIRVFSRSQTDITCEEFFSLNEEAYKIVYKHDPPKNSHQEKEEFMKKLFFSIVEGEQIQETIPRQLSQYPFYDEYSAQQEVMPLRTIDEEDVLEKTLQKLGEGCSVFLIGEYGSGKTHMTYRIVKTILEHPDTYAFYPLWFRLIESSIELSDANMKSSAITFIQEGLKKHSGLSGNFSYGGRKKILIILDGLDEIVSGLEESKKKVDFLREVCKQFVIKYGNNALFVITSRERDFKSCSNSQDFGRFFQSFGRIIIGECRQDDAVEKLLTVQNSVKNENGAYSVLEMLSQNSNLVSIARKPLYFGFLRELILTKEIADCKDELDILNAIIHRSIQYCLNQEDYSHDLTERDIMEILCTYAREISVQLGKGECDEIMVLHRLFPEKCGRNVIQLRRINTEKYALRFYHNAIREYLVANSLYQKMESCLYNKTGNGSKELFEWLVELDMTPETIDFFCKLADREPVKKQQITELLLEILKTAKKPELCGLGTHVISLLFRLQPKISNQDLRGIYANHVFLWNCSLEDVDLRNAHLPNLCLFNAKLQKVDFRGADLNGLLMGTEDEVLDVKHFISNDKMVITILYSNGQLIDYVFLDYHNLELYSIVNRTNLHTIEYKNMYLLENDILLHSRNKVAFLSDIEKTYDMEEGYELIQIDNRSVMVLKNGNPHLVFHDRKYQQRHIRCLPEGDFKNVFIIDSNIYLYVRDRKLFVQQGDKYYFVIDLNLHFECFTAFKRKREDTITIFVKSSDDIQIIRYDLKNDEKEYDYMKLQEYHTYWKLVAISENLLYGISERVVFLHDVLNSNVLRELKVQVKCKDLILENEDGTERVQGNAEYQLLRDITIHTPMSFS